MEKNEALKSAKIKANLSKKNQVVFSYIAGGDPVGWTVLAYDYTHEILWDRRHYRPPITTKVAVVTPDVIDGEKKKLMK